MADADQVLKLAAIIRKVDGTHSKGSAALAESILDHPDFRAALAKADGPAVPQGREPAAVTEQPSDEEIMGLMPQQMHEDLAYAARAMANEAGTDNRKAKGFMRIALNRHAVDLARAVLAHWGNPAPAPPADGEVAELVAALRTDAECVAAEQPDLMQLTDKQLTRAADLLECLEQVAYAASDFICGTRFPEFANEHGGIDRLMADLCRLVAQFEHGPRPVPGVDVPGPDGDWGGLAELCNAEGVDLRIGVPLLQRAREAWKYASQAAPVPAEGEVAELVEWLQEEADDYECIGCEDSAAKCKRAAELLQRQVPLPVAVSERLPEPSDCAPWPDEPAASAWCWVGSDVDGGWSWEQRSAGCLAAFPDDFTHWLPAHALPLPEVGE